MSCFRGNRVWKLVKIDVDDGDEEWDETKANLSWIFKSRIPTQILWIWNFSDSVFWTSSIPLPSSFFPFSFFFYFYYLPFDAYEISLLWNLKSIVWWYRPLNSTSIFELLLIFWQGKLEGLLKNRIISDNIQFERREKDNFLLKELLNEEIFISNKISQN